MRSCAAASEIGRSSANERRSPLTVHCRAGNVTFRPVGFSNAITLRRRIHDGRRQADRAAGCARKGAFIHSF
jgi:hypothetical protein